MNRLSYVRDELVGAARSLFVLSVLLGVLVIAVFGWDLPGVAIWTLVGVVLWGGAKFFEIKARLPRGELLKAPPDARIGLEKRGLAARTGMVLFAIVICVGAAFLADRWDMGAAFVPGQLAGYACAYAAGALWVLRWERRHGRRVLIENNDDDEPALYAARR